MDQSSPEAVPAPIAGTATWTTARLRHLIDLISCHVAETGYYMDVRDQDRFIQEALGATIDDSAPSKETLVKIKELTAKLDRGCDCEYDYRCTNCSRILALKDLIKESL